MTYVYAGAADWGGKDPAKCNRGLYRLAMDTGTWTTLERGLRDEVEVWLVARPTKRNLQTSILCRCRPENWREVWMVTRRIALCPAVVWHCNQN